MGLSCPGCCCRSLSNALWHCTACSLPLELFRWWHRSWTAAHILRRGDHLSSPRESPQGFPAARDSQGCTHCLKLCWHQRLCPWDPLFVLLHPLATLWELCLSPGPSQLHLKGLWCPLVGGICTKGSGHAWVTDSWFSLLEAARALSHSHTWPYLLLICSRFSESSHGCSDYPGSRSS